jgi:DNA-binding transcriptional LysR family regulator
MFKNLFQTSGLSLERLKGFLDVADAGGMTKAADGDPSRQSLYSRQVKELEEFFGTELIRRSGRGIELTDKGRQLAGAIRESLSALSEFHDSCDGARQVYSIGAGQALLQWIVLPALISLRDRLPDTDFAVQNLRTQDVVDGVNELKTDFGLIRSNAVGPRQESIRLGTVDYALFVPKSLLRVPARAGWRMVLDKAPLATMDSDGQFRAALLGAAEKVGIDLRIALRCTSFPLAAAALETGEYAAILPSMAGRFYSKESYHQISVPFLKAQAREISLVWNRRLPSVKKRSAKILKMLGAKLRF